MHIVTASEMQQMDRETIESFGLPGRVLMENAGRGVIDVLVKTFPDIKSIGRNQSIGIVAGRGNNGGDGFVIARYLSGMGVSVSVYLFSERAAVKGDAAANLNLLDALEVPVFEITDTDTPGAASHGHASSPDLGGCASGNRTQFRGKRTFQGRH